MYRNPKDIKRQTQYKSDLKAGRCVAGYGVECGCSKCERHDKAYSTVDSKPANVTGYGALVESGFSDEEAMEYIFEFDDLGIFDGAELFCHGIVKAS